MTVYELIMKMSRYPSDFKVVLNTSCDYEDYGEVNSVTPVKYSYFRGGNIDRESKEKNAMYLR